MKMFKFSLQKLLDVKEAMERQCELKMADVQRKLKAANEKKETLEKNLEKQSLLFEGIEGKTGVRKELGLHLKYINWIEKRIESQSRSISECVMEVEEVRAELLELLKERKSLDRLKKREFKEWNDELRRQERNEMDEIASTRFAHQRKTA